MSFGAPQWFGALLLLPLLAGLFLRNEMLRENLLKKLVAARLLPDLAASTSAARRRWKFVLALLGLASVILALAQPRAGYDIVETHHRGLDLMIAVDTSKSMLSTDVQPTRLSRSKLAGEDLIDSLDGDRVGLIAFAGAAFVEAPLTIDYSAVVNSLNALDTDTIPRGGTNIASAIREADEAFGKGESTHRALVLFTDGEELDDDAVQAAKEMNGKFRIFTVGVGTREGSLIPQPGANGGTEFVKDDQGQYVKSRLNEEKLKAIANATGGFYIHLDSGTGAAKAIIDQGLRRMQEHEFQTKETIPIERYEWPLAAGILLLIASMMLSERRRIEPGMVRRRRPAEAALTVGVALLIFWPACGWSKNEGVDLYEQKNYKGAYDVFQQQLQRNPASDGLEFDRGTAAYKEGDYDKALEAFGKVLGSADQGLRGQAEYNLGNTLVERGALQEPKDEKIKEWNEALKHYDQALKTNPNNADAKYNSDVVRKMIDELNKKQQQQNQQQNQQQQNQQNQQQQNQQQQNQQQQNQQQQNQQQQNQQQQNQQQQNQQQQNQQQQGGQNQQQQNQQGKNQQQQGGQNQKQQNQQAQNQQQQGGQNQQPQNQQAQNQQQQGGQNQQQQKQQAQNQQQGGQGRQNQQQGGKENEQNQASANPTQEMNGASPSPTPGNGPGVLKEQAQQQQKEDARAAARGATEQARPGEMTPSQAKALIDSLRGEEQHVSFEDRQHPENEPVYKDW